MVIGRDSRAFHAAYRPETLAHFGEAFAVSTDFRHPKHTVFGEANLGLITREGAPL